MEEATGILLLVGAGLVNGSFTAPMKWILDHNHRTHWKYQHCWFLYTISALIIYPWSFALIFIGPTTLLDAYQEVGFSDWFWPIVCGLAWGVGSATLGIGIERIGLSLGTALVLGVTSSFGSLGTLVAFRTDKIFTYEGLLTTLGVVVTIIGLIVISLAGDQKEKEENSLHLRFKDHSSRNLLQENRLSQVERNLNGEEILSDDITKGFEGSIEGGRKQFISGLTICILSGILGAFQNFGLQLSEDLVDKVKDKGVSEVEATFSALCLVISSLGALGNGAPAVWRLFKEDEWHLFITGDLSTPDDSQFVQSGYSAINSSSRYRNRVYKSLLKQYGLCFFGMGGFWFSGILLYGWGAQLLDNFSISWALFMCTTIMTSNFWSVGFGEWSNCSSYVIKIFFLGIFILTSAVVLLAGAVAV